MIMEFGIRKLTHYICFIGKKKNRWLPAQMEMQTEETKGES